MNFNILGLILLMSSLFFFSSCRKLEINLQQNPLQSLIFNVDDSITKGTTDYTIKTEITPLDFLISVITGWVTIYPMSVEVRK